MAREVLEELEEIQLPKDFILDLRESIGKRKVLLDISGKDELKKMLYLIQMLIKEIQSLENSSKKEQSKEKENESRTGKFVIEENISLIREMFWMEVNRRIPREIHRILRPNYLILTNEWKIVGNYGMRVVISAGDCN